MSINETLFADLTLIKGIGPARQQWLRQSFGVRSYADLAALLPDDIEAMLKADGQIARRSAVEEWVAQAQTLSGTAAPRPLLTLPADEFADWHPFASFVVEIQAREEDGRTAATRTAVQHIERDKNATWPGIERELVGTKAYYTRDGYFDNVDVCLFTHVGSNLGVSYGPASGTGLISVEYTFSGESAHSAGAPWRGRSAADAVELMNIGWQYQREHLEPMQRSHSVITNGGDQPNVVPSKASIWYYFREMTYPAIMDLYAQGNRIADGAAMMTRTTVTRKTLGSAWPRHFNKLVAEAMNENIKVVGLPTWSEKDQLFARAVQKEVQAKEDLDGMPTKLDEFKPPAKELKSGGSDDIGDISWKVPTVTLRYPANIPGLPGHNWANAIAMATPIAHKGVTAGARVQAMTIIDLLTNPALVANAKDYFQNEQLAKQEYKPMITKEDKPAIYLNTEIMKEYRPQLEKYYYDETKYGSYLEQLGITYPTIKK